MSNDRPDVTPTQKVRPRRGVMLVISSPSGAGKTTLCRRIISEVPGVELSISATTRSPRPGEQDGADYHFRSVDQFHDMIDRDEFLEWAKVFKNFYGTPRSEVEARLVAGMDVVFDVDWQGARALIGHLKGIGAVVPDAGHRPLSPAALRRVMAAYDEAGGRDVYQLLIGRVTRADQA
jgi:guanylate kinase